MDSTPQSPPQPPTGAAEPHHPPAEPRTDEPSTEGKATRFRFKSKHSKSSRRHRDEDDDAARAEDSGQERSNSGRHHHHRSHHHHHRKRRRSRSPSGSPRRTAADADAGGNANANAEASLDPDTAFRESLFDAMADDEGAAYWEGVYGQPIHIYARTRGSGDNNDSSTTTNGPSNNPPASLLEHMTDDEYATYVRQRMWERTHAGLLEERARRARDAAERERQSAEAGRVAREVERSLRRGEDRRRKRAWLDGWERYVARWAARFAKQQQQQQQAEGGEKGERKEGGGEAAEDGREMNDGDGDDTGAGIAWPVRSGRREDITAEEVRAFFVNGLDLEAVGEREFSARLKDERVRWHPDKMQQRLGGQIDAVVMKDITRVFQSIDQLWADTRPKS